MTLYWSDEARFSKTTDVGYTWFRPSSRPELKASVSRQSWHMVAAVEPEWGDQFSLLLSWLDADAYNLFLREFAKHLSESFDLKGGEEVWLVVDRAGWHVAKKLKIPKGLKLIVMPTGGALINPVEQLWLYIREHYTRNRVWEDLEELVEVLCRVDADLLADPERVASICGWASRAA